MGISADGPFIENVRDQGVRVITVPLTRKIAPFKDCYCLWILFHIFRKEKFDLIHYSTPKVSFLGALAGRLSGCPALLYTLRGLGYSGYHGLTRWVGKLCEKIACRSADRIIAISPSLIKEAHREKLAPNKVFELIGKGSSKGVNLEKFSLTDNTLDRTRQIRQMFHMESSDLIIGYAGRMTAEKGIGELASAFRNLSQDRPNIHLMLIGHADQRSPLANSFVCELQSHERIHIIPFTNNLADYYGAMDIAVLPSYREGFGNSLIEASAMALPVIATNVVGCCDAVIHGTTGLLVEPGNANALQSALAELLDDKDRRDELGRNGRRWVEKNFDRNAIWEGLVTRYSEMVSKN